MSDSRTFHVGVEVADKFASGAATGSGWAKAIAASEGYRKYSWIANAPVRNSAGNFRGMVLSPKWAARFQWAEKTLKPVENAALLLSFAANVDRARHEIGEILNSRDDWTAKGSRLSAQLSAVALRTLAGIGTGYLDLSTFVVSGYLQAADLAGFHRAAGWNKALIAADAKVNAFADTVTDGNNIYLFINAHVIMR